MKLMIVEGCDFMKWKEIAKKYGIELGLKLVENTPQIVDSIVRRKEEKSFFEENKSWIFIIILSIFVIKLDYITMFENVILNSIINIIFGIIVFVLLCLFYYEEKNIFKFNSLFIKTLTVFLIVLGIINSFYHIGYAMSLLFL